MSPEVQSSPQNWNQKAPEIDSKHEVSFDD